MVLGSIDPTPLDSATDSASFDTPQDPDPLTAELPHVDFLPCEADEELEAFFAAMDAIPDTPIEINGVTETTHLVKHPRIDFVDEEDLCLFESRLSASSREDQRLLDTVSRIQQAGGCTRPLQILPPQWDLLLDVFEETFPNFVAVADYLRDHFSLASIGNNAIHFPPLLLVGEPGIGKTEAARWLASRLNVPFCMIDMASAQTGAALSGSERFWTNSRSGQVFETLCFETFANPIIMLDELDKTLGDARFDPFAPLYTLLEPSSAQTFVDLSIGDFAINASRVSWIATANSLEAIPRPLQTRLTVIHIQTPSPEQARCITLNIYKRILAEGDWGDFFKPELEEGIVDILISHPPRVVKIALTRALGSAARHQRHAIGFSDLVLPHTQHPRGIGFLAI